MWRHQPMNVTWHLGRLPFGQEIQAVYGMNFLYRVNSFLSDWLAHLPRKIKGIVVLLYCKHAHGILYQISVHSMLEKPQDNYCHWRCLFCYSKRYTRFQPFNSFTRVTCRSVIHSSIRLFGTAENTKCKSSQLGLKWIPNYIKPAQISGQNDNLHILGIFRPNFPKSSHESEQTSQNCKAQTAKAHGWSITSSDPHKGVTEGRGKINCP